MRKRGKHLVGLKRDDHVVVVESLALSLGPGEHAALGDGVTHAGNDNGLGSAG